VYSPQKEIRIFHFFVSLLLLFGYNGRVSGVPSEAPATDGGRHVSEADKPYPQPIALPDSDGEGGHNPTKMTIMTIIEDGGRLL
jgi:hypothetical protein